ncbi:hypothetical protein Bca52824_022041 [Brassica carinata]|uniref:Uncharacterized protein n=1 Tax=Brassica carinata TaxID=52824 RepID=A0A8X7VFN2_BRACI|nr:hypothetical protein Bca52824_022041 [Brassica carinata]
MGRVAFKVLMDSLWNKDITGCYTVDGFIQVLQVWVYTAMPNWVLVLVVPEETVRSTDTGLRGSRGRRSMKEAILRQQLNDAIAKKHVEELEVSRIQGKLELMNELFKKNPFSKEKKKQLDFELVRAEAKVADVQIPYIDWYKLNEPHMFD